MRGCNYKFLQYLYIILCQFCSALLYKIVWSHAVAAQKPIHVLGPAVTVLPVIKHNYLSARAAQQHGSI